MSSPGFANSGRMKSLLTFIVEHALAGRAEELKETVIGVEVFGRPPGYDPQADGVVRGEARRLRMKLAEYYAGPGANDLLVIELPKGTYVPVFREGEHSAQAASQALAQLGAERALARQSPSKRKRALISAGAAVAVALGIVVLSVAHIQPPPPAIPRLVTTGLKTTRGPSFSPDGRQLVFSSDAEGQSHIQTVDLASGATRDITTGDVRDYWPSWSPDGKTIAFLRRHAMNRCDLMLAELATGSARVLTSVTRLYPIDWSRDGKYVAVSDQSAGQGPFAISLVSTEDGARRQVTVPSLGTNDVEPRFSESGRFLAFERVLGDSVNDLYVVSMSGANVPQGEPRRLTSEKQVMRGLTWAPDGNSLIVSMRRGSTARSLWRVPVDGHTPARIPEAGIDPITPASSRTAGRMAYAVAIEDTNIWRVGEAAPLIRSDRGDTGPQFSPAGDRIVFRSTRSGSDAIWIAGRDGRRTTLLVDCKGAVCGSPRWSPDGARIAFDSRESGSADIYYVPAEGGKPLRVTTEASNEVVPSWSRDGQSLYFASNRTGAWEIWRQRLGGVAADQMTVSGGFAAFESSDGKYLYFAKPAGQRGIWRKPVAGGPDEVVLPEFEPAMWGSWALVPTGIYFIPYNPLRAGGPAAIEFLDFATGQRREAGRTTAMPVLWDGSLAASPATNDLLFSQLDHSGADIYVIDGMR